jgi:hypothetical protein
MFARLTTTVLFVIVASARAAANGGEKHESINQTGRRHQWDELTSLSTETRKSSLALGANSPPEQRLQMCVRVMRGSHIQAERVLGGRCSVCVCVCVCVCVGGCGLDRMRVKMRVESDGEWIGLEQSGVSGGVRKTAKVCWGCFVCGVCFVCFVFIVFCVCCGCVWCFCVLVCGVVGVPLSLQCPVSCVSPVSL